MPKPADKIRYCPPIINKENRAKITGPAWNGESTEEAIKMWNAFVRIIAIQRPMPANYRGEGRSKKKNR